MRRCGWRFAPFSIDRHICHRCDFYSPHPLHTMVKAGESALRRVCYRCERELASQGWTRERRKALHS